MSENRAIRIGIDVGGTFTHAVAVEAKTLGLLGQVKVPTTHTSKSGVAEGIILSLKELLDQFDIKPDEVVLIAHSTTQATNALLEGDVAPVGIIGIAGGGGFEGWLSNKSTNIHHLEIAPGKFLKTYHRFVKPGIEVTESLTKKLIEELILEGAKVIVASQSFGVDKPQAEKIVVETALQMGVPATAGHMVSQLYGLKVRTRTAVINASMLIKMIETADMTEKSVRKTGIKAPLMIMRSDGGIMNIDEMRKRPILTMLSGPAAGVAAALMYARISDGIFAEVGGTSTDISAIRNGHAQVKTGEIGGHKIYLRTLDVRTVGVAGGSIPRIHNNEIHAVGPRSAHIAGLGYSAFMKSHISEPVKCDSTTPVKGDPDDYLVINKEKERITITPTCASNYLGLVEDGDAAKGNIDKIKKVFGLLGEKWNKKPDEIAKQLLDHAVPPVIDIVEDLMTEYKLDPEMTTLIGGGGGASAIVPYTAKKMELKSGIAPNAAVISAIGAALAMVRETVEKSVMNPSSDEIISIKREAESAVIEMGAAPGTIETFVEIDAQKNILRATASGSTEIRQRTKPGEVVDDNSLKTIAANSMRLETGEVEKIGGTDHLSVFKGQFKTKRFGGLWSHTRNAYRVLDYEGIIRLQIGRGVFLSKPKLEFRSSLSDFLDKQTEYGDAGRSLPMTFLLSRGRVIDFSGILQKEHILSLAEVELQEMGEDEPICALLNFI